MFYYAPHKLSVTLENSYSLFFAMFGLKNVHTNSHFNMLHVAEEAMELEEDLIEIAEEADLIQEERMIEDGWTIGPGAGKDDKKKKEMEETAREVEELMLAMNLDKADIQAEQNEEGWQVILRR